MILRLILLILFMVFILPLSYVNKNKNTNYDNWKHKQKGLKQKILEKHGLN